MNYYQQAQMDASAKRALKQQFTKITLFDPCRVMSLDALHDEILALFENQGAERDLYEHFGKETEVPVEFAIRHNIPF